MRAVTMTLVLAASLGMASHIMNTPAVAAQQESQAGEGKTTELSGKVESVNVQTKTIKLEGVTEVIVVTDSTRFSGGITFETLKSGMSVKINGKVVASGRVEASEVAAV